LNSIQLVSRHKRNKQSIGTIKSINGNGNVGQISFSIPTSSSSSVAAVAAVEDDEPEHQKSTSPQTSV